MPCCRCLAPQRAEACARRARGAPKIGWRSLLFIRDVALIIACVTRVFVYTNRVCATRMRSAGSRVVARGRSPGERA
eukprot:scaffold9852_cov112-Isochrysis_galbana.AAC.1